MRSSLGTPSASTDARQDISLGAAAASSERTSLEQDRATDMRQSLSESTSSRKGGNTSVGVDKTNAPRYVCDEKSETDDNAQCSASFARPYDVCSSPLSQTTLQSQLKATAAQPSQEHKAWHRVNHVQERVSLQHLQQNVQSKGRSAETPKSEKPRAGRQQQRSRSQLNGTVPQPLTASTERLNLFFHQQFGLLKSQHVDKFAHHHLDRKLMRAGWPGEDSSALCAQLVFSVLGQLFIQRQTIAYPQEPELSCCIPWYFVPAHYDL